VTWQDQGLGDRDRNALRVLEGETEKEVSAMLGSYDMCSSDREDERSPPKLEMASEFRHIHHSPPFHPPPHTMDISSVRFRPVPVMAQAEMTSTYGHPRLNLPEMGKVNIIIDQTILIKQSKQAHKIVIKVFISKLGRIDLN